MKKKDERVANVCIPVKWNVCVEKLIVIFWKAAHCAKWAVLGQMWLSLLQSTVLVELGNVPKL